MGWAGIRPHGPSYTLTVDEATTPGVLRLTDVWQPKLPDFGAILV